MDIKKKRLAAGVLQGDLAEALNVTPRTLCNWENGTIKPKKYVINFIKILLKNKSCNRK